jgi:pSer/pThr/pTyr-binding forkhead associated (FHA) protein
MKAKLVLASGKKAGLEVPVKRKKFFIGRAKDCQLRLRSELVGRHHCVIVVQDRLVVVRDFGTKGGTVVNGETVTGERELNDGDRLNVGSFEFEVRLGVGADEETKPATEPANRAGDQTVKSSEDNDLDLDSWLNDPETIDAGHVQTTGKESPETVGPEPTERERQKNDPVQVVGVCQKGRWSPTTVDPRTAAADALNGFFGRRP